MSWKLVFLKEAEHDMEKLDHSLQVRILKGKKKVSTNPLPNSKGGYGKPLGNVKDKNLTNLLKIKFRDIGIRVVYKLEMSYKEMKIIVISVRDDGQVYKKAAYRRSKYDI